MLSFLNLSPHGRAPTPELRHICLLRRQTTPTLFNPADMNLIRQANPFPLDPVYSYSCMLPGKDTPAYLRHQLKHPLYLKYVANFSTSRSQFTLLVLLVRRFFAV